MKYFVEELGVDPNLRDMDGFHRFITRQLVGDNETIAYLVEKGADADLDAVGPNHGEHGEQSRATGTTTTGNSSPARKAEDLSTTTTVSRRTGRNQ